MFVILTKKDESQKVPIKKHPFATGLFFAYILMLFYITLFAWNYGASLGPLGPGGRNYNLTPFLTIYRISVFSNDFGMIFRILIGNVLLFVPFGFLFPYILKQVSWTRKPIRIVPIVILGMFLSFMIELTQFVFTYRVANVDDIILNTTGTLLGVIVFRIITKIKIIAVY